MAWTWGDLIEALIVSQSDGSGGAARAAYRLHRALRSAGVDSSMRVRNKSSDDWSVTGGAMSPTARLAARIRPAVEFRLMRLQRSPNPVLHSANLLPSRWSRAINADDADVVNLHWVGSGALSVEDIGRIRGPAVMTLHDMWAFCGAEHYAPDSADARWRTGYTRLNRESGHRGLDLDRLTWLRKRRAWRAMTVVCPSQWLANCVVESKLMGDWPVEVVPNPLDTSVFRPLGRAEARRLLRLPQDCNLVLFGAVGGTLDPRKGFDLLMEALEIWDPPAATSAVIFGQGEPEVAEPSRIPIHWMGRVGDDTTLALLYSAADVMVVPSRQEAFGQTASEAQACGTPVVAFNVSGLPDVVAHRETGYLATPFSAPDLATGISWVLEDEDRCEQLGAAARRRAVRLWDSRVVAARYVDVFQRAGGEGSP